VKTNIPQTLMVFPLITSLLKPANESQTADTHNNIFGRVLNPYRLCLTAGGSSGGEGALSALHGSVLGVGTDIAGSIRIPAFCNGVTGFKPTARRIPYSGQTGPGRPGRFGILASAGPICHSIADAQYFMANVLDHDCWTLDEGVVSVLWREMGARFEGKNLRIGVIGEDVQFPLLPPMARIYAEVEKKVSAAGHTLIHLQLPANNLYTTTITAVKSFSQDPSSVPFQHIAASGEPIIPSIPTTFPPELAGYKPTLDGVFDLNVEIAKVQKFWREIWVGNELDAVIMPVHQGTPPKHDEYGGPPYTVLANLLDVSGWRRVVKFGVLLIRTDLVSFLRNSVWEGREGEGQRVDKGREICASL
jgi:amidase